ncbi:MAG: polyprenyl synthetase family protein [bacterium]|nr:polyprenyl synthetase family protein [bacterium]
MLQRAQCVDTARDSSSASGTDIDRLSATSVNLNSDASRDVVSSHQADRDGSDHQCGSKLRVEHSIRSLVGNHLLEIERTMRLACRSRSAEVSHLCEHVESLGGKRLRPILAVLSAQACEYADPSLLHRPQSERLASSRDLVYIGAALELVHAASLVHDDVMDQADTRRHRPTVGTVAGGHAAILLGDFLFTKAYDLAARCRLRYPARRLAKAASALCEGELEQQLSAGNWSISIQHYMELLSRKTGALCAVSCRLGAFAAGGSSPHVYSRCLARFGLDLGLAFQLFDDWLDYWGSDRTGKTLGTDLAQCKPTLPLLRLLAVGSPATRRELIRLLQPGQHSDEQRLRIREMLDASDASEYTLQAAGQYVHKAVESLNVLPDCEPKSCLQQIARFSVSRIS